MDMMVRIVIMHDAILIYIEFVGVQSTAIELGRK